MPDHFHVLCGGPSTEHEVSLSSGKVVCERINLNDRKITPVVITKAGRWIFSEKILCQGEGRDWLQSFFQTMATPSPEAGCNIAEALTRLYADTKCVFIAMHGQFGEDGTLQGFLQAAGIPFTGSGVQASAVAFNKALTIAAYRMAGLQTARGVHIRGDVFDIAKADGLVYPLFVKPVKGGSSVGLSLVRELGGLSSAVGRSLSLDNEVLIEERVEGVEVSCGVLDLIVEGRAVSTAQPPTEIRPLECDFFDYEAKYVAGKSKDVTPADLPLDKIARIQQCAVIAHQILGCEGMSRTDMIIPYAPDAVPVLIETNTIPGMTPTSLLPQQCAAVGIDFPSFVDRVLEHALFRAKSNARI